VARFSIQSNPFGRAAQADDDEDDGTGLPSPMLLRLHTRRRAGIREARDVLAHLPEPGESLHAIVTTRLDLSDLLSALLERCGTCEKMAIATLSYNERNLRHLLGWLDAGAVRHLTLLCSIFFRSHKGALWTETLTALRQRGQRAACRHSHAKVVTMAFQSGQRLVVEGSANLCSSGSGREQVTIISDTGLHDWSEAWIREQVTRGEQREQPDAG
jgi:hypothetical protein